MRLSIKRKSEKKKKKKQKQNTKLEEWGFHVCGGLSSLWRCGAPAVQYGLGSEGFYKVESFCPWFSKGILD